MAEQLGNELCNEHFAVTAQAPLARLTTFRVGGQAEWLALPKTLEQLTAALTWGQSQGFAGDAARGGV